MTRSSRTSAGSADLGAAVGTCYAPQVGRLPDALRLLKDAKEAELAGEGGMNGHGSGDGGGRESLPSAEDGLKHLMLYTDVETLYRWAALSVSSG